MRTQFQAAAHAAASVPRGITPGRWGRRLLLLLGTLLAVPAIAPVQAQQKPPQNRPARTCTGTASQILNLAVTPRGGDPWVFVNRQADVTGTVADASDCGVAGQQVALLAMWGLVNPAYATSSASGQFQTSYTATSTAGPQKVNAVLFPSDSGFAWAAVPVHPILNSVTPGIGPVAGGQNATLNGDGYAFGNTGSSSVNFGGVALQMGSVALQSITVVTPHSPLAGNGDGVVDVVATANGLDSLGVPYQYVLPGKPYISFHSINCKTHYIVVTVYDQNAQPVAVPIQLSAGYPAYRSNGQGVANLTTTSGTWVQVDGGGPFTATNQSSNLSNTASFPVLPGPICYNIRNITKVDWHIFEKPGDLTPQELSHVVQEASGAAGGGLRVRSVGQDLLRGAIHGQVFLGGSGALETESAPGAPEGSVLDAQFVGPAFSITRGGQREDAAAPLGRQMLLTLRVPAGRDPHAFHIVHLTRLDGQPMWVEDGTAEVHPQNGTLMRRVTDGGIYALIEVVGISTENLQRGETTDIFDNVKSPASGHKPQQAPPGSTVLVPENAFPGGVLTGVVLGPDDKPVPNTPVNIAGGVPITLTGVVMGEQSPTQPQPPRPQPCQPDAAGKLSLGCAPPVVNQPADCAAVLQQFGRTAAEQAMPQPGVAAPGQAGTSPAAVERGGGPRIITDANGRFAMCIPVDAPKVNVALPGGATTSVPAVMQAPALPLQPPSFLQPSQKISLIGVLRDLKAEQGGRAWEVPVVQAISSDGGRAVTAFQTPRDLQPGPVSLSYTGSDGQPHHVPGNIFRIVSATLDRSRLHSDQGATFQYVVQFGAQPGQNLCVEMHVGGPVVLVEAPSGVLAPDASGRATFGGRIRATQVAPGAAVPFELTPNIVYCAGTTSPTSPGAEMQGPAAGTATSVATARPMSSLTIEERLHLPDTTMVTLRSSRVASLGTLRAEHEARLHRFSNAAGSGQGLLSTLHPIPSPLITQAVQVLFQMPLFFGQIPIDYANFCKAVNPTVCLYLPANTYLYFLGSTGSTLWVEEDDGLITDRSVCAYDGGLPESGSSGSGPINGCSFFYPVTMVTDFQPTGPLTTKASCGAPSTYVVDPKGAVSASRPVAGHFTTGASPETCVVQVWVGK